MKPTAKNIAEYARKEILKPVIIKGKEYPHGNNVAIHLPNLNSLTLKSLQENYGFKKVERQFLGYIRFEI